MTTASKPSNPIKPESFFKNIILALYFAAGSGLLISAYFFRSQSFGPQSTALLALYSVAAFAIGAFLTVPSRRTATPPVPGDSALIRPESQVKNVFIAAYFAAGAAGLTFARLLLLDTHLVATKGPHIVRPAFVSNYNVREIAIVGGVALVWLIFGTLLLIPSRIRTTASAQPSGNSVTT